MPYEAARIIRTVESVRVERVQETTQEDAVRCGYTEESFWANHEGVVGFSVGEYYGRMSDFSGKEVNPIKEDASPEDWAIWLYSTCHGPES